MQLLDKRFMVMHADMEIISFAHFVYVHTEI